MELLGSIHILSSTILYFCVKFQEVLPSRTWILKKQPNAMKYQEMLLLIHVFVAKNHVLSFMSLK